METYCSLRAAQEDLKKKGQETVGVFVEREEHVNTYLVFLSTHELLEFEKLLQQLKSTPVQGRNGVLKAIASLTGRSIVPDFVEAAYKDGEWLLDPEELAAEDADLLEMGTPPLEPDRSDLDNTWPSGCTQTEIGGPEFCY